MHFIRIVCQLMYFDFVFVVLSHNSVITQESEFHCLRKKKKKDDKLHISNPQCILMMDNMPENKDNRPEQSVY